MNTSQLIAAATALVVSSGGLHAQGFETGEVGVSYGQTDIDGLDSNVEAFGVHGALDFDLGARVGVQIGAAHNNASIDDEFTAEIDLSTTSADIHLYTYLTDDFRAGAFVGYTDIGDVSIEGLGSTDIDSSVFSYGVELQSNQRRFNYHGYAGIAEVEDADFVDVTLFGFGAGYDIAPSFEVTGNYDRISLAAQEFDVDADISSLSLGLNYYLAPQTDIPVRLSASVSRDSLNVSEVGTEDTNTIAVGATYLFGGESKWSDRRHLLDSLYMPF